MQLTPLLVRTAVNAASFVSAPLAGRAAYAFFRLPLRRSKLRDQERELLAGARRGELTVRGKRVVTYHWGSGERPVLFVHGWRSRGSRGAALIAGLLERGYSPVAFDAPAHGDSAGRRTTVAEFGEAVRALQREYGAEGGGFEAVVAHSAGALAAFCALREGGLRAERAVLIGAVVDFAYITDGFCAALGLRAPVREALRRRVQRELYPAEPDRDVWERLSVTARPGDVRTPLLVVHDEDDDTVEAAQSLRITAAYGDQARLLRTSGLGHRRILADGEVVDTVLDFVDGARTAPEAAGAR
ncbi:alpha/beta hydrolase [Streptomyces armeniacus]|uniref:Alpha/beta hydrolase n=1 Tax=Streptomyces armeniacus TaxID=83291 RepID=A0A345XJD5_9ACTN|nr:alpha/beta hydrolase [Streptomyces armeniacus]AXK31751.1 alpha/beta hydrolase [Streptomyces armeniacus]